MLDDMHPSYNPNAHTYLMSLPIGIHAVGRMKQAAHYGSKEYKQVDHELSHAIRHLRFIELRGDTGRACRRTRNGIFLGFDKKVGPDVSFRPGPDRNEICIPICDAPANRQRGAAGRNLHKVETCGMSRWIAGSQAPMRYSREVCHESHGSPAIGLTVNLLRILHEHRL